MLPSVEFIVIHNYCKVIHDFKQTQFFPETPSEAT